MTLNPSNPVNPAELKQMIGGPERSALHMVSRNAATLQRQAPTEPGGPEGSALQIIKNAARVPSICRADLLGAPNHEVFLEKHFVISCFRGDNVDWVHA